MQKGGGKLLFETMESRTLAAGHPVGTVYESIGKTASNSTSFLVTTDAEMARGTISIGLINSAAILNAKGTLLVQGTPNDDSIRLHKSGKTLEITVTTGAPSAIGSGKLILVNTGSTGSERHLPSVMTFTTGELNFTFSVSATQVKRIVVDGAAGHDVLKYDTAAPTQSNIEHTIIQPPPAPAGETPSDPAAGTYDGGGERAWKTKLAQQLSDAQESDASLAFFGDSHAERYPYYGRRSWNADFADAFDLGTSGDSTRQLLARIQAGLFQDFKPDKLVLMIGTNNFNNPTTGGTDEQIEAGIRSVVLALQDELPKTQIVIVSILPRGEPGMNERIQNVNAMTAELDGQKNLHFLDVYDHFVGQPLRDSLYNGDNHLNANGYRLLTTYLAALLNSI